MTSSNGQSEALVETISVFRVGLLKETESSSNTDSMVSSVEGLPVGSALSVIKWGPNAGSRFLFDQAVTAAGHHPGSDISLDGVTVSRHHVEFRKNGDSYEVVDVGLLNGTYVNREPKDSTVLANGDEAQVGRSRLVFLIGNQSDIG